MAFRAERLLCGHYMQILCKVDNEEMVPQTTARWSLDGKRCVWEIRLGRHI